jgi:hypothetical protein
MTLKSELCCKRYSLRSRLKLFDAVITPTILYACGSWTMTSSREMLLLTTQRKMLRKILGLGRKLTSCAPRTVDDTDGRKVGSSDSDDSEAREILASAYPSRPKEWVAPLRPVVVGSRRRCFGAAPPSSGCSSTIRTVGAVAPWWPIDERPREEGSAPVWLVCASIAPVHLMPLCRRRR